MCGLFGSITRKPLTEQRANAAHRIQAHRGPDGQGSWRAQAGASSIYLGHQRLAIIDLSDAGRQPMQHECGAVVAFNGEIYNYVELREQLELEGERFASQSDTEVLLKAFVRWGVPDTLRRCNGMWAIAYVEPALGRLSLSRDRCGEKPLYYTATDDGVAFASEVKTLLTLTGKRYRVNHQVVAEYLEQAVLDGSCDTFFADIQQVPAGTVVTIDVNTRHIGPPVAYWSAAQAAAMPPADDVFERLRHTFDEAVRIRLRSDVPVGILVSGGLDSSAIAAAAHESVGAHGDLTLLSAVSDDPRFDESQFARRVARHLDRKLIEVRLDLRAENALDLLARACYVNDEPVGTFSAVAHYLLMQQAKEASITVVLSGQGGDELLCGYRKYLGFHLQELVRRGRLLEASRILTQFMRRGTVVTQFTLGEAGRYLPRFLHDASATVLGRALESFPRRSLGLPAGTTVQARQAIDVSTFSVPALTHYEDRMSMAWGREIRLPFLDPNLLDLMLAAPTATKLHDGWTKFALRRAMSQRLPPEIVWRKDKQGFSTPQSEWLRGALSSRLDQLFGEDCLMYRMGLVDPVALRRLYAAYKSLPPGSDRIGLRRIFAPLALELWLRQYESSLSF
jgi:asparagine synthase (glutamine-hydrolysing)